MPKAILSHPHWKQILARTVRWLTEPAAGLQEPEHRRSHILAWLQIVLILLVSVTLVLALLLNASNHPRYGLYIFMITVLLLGLMTALGLNRRGHYGASAHLTVTCAFLGPWGSLLLDPAVIGGDFVPLAYSVIPLILASILVSMRMTVSLTILQLGLLLWLAYGGPQPNSINWVSFFVFILFVSILGAVSNFLNLQNLKQIDEQTTLLFESEARFRSLYENVPTGIYRTSPDGQILMANPALIKMLGYETFEELSQRNLEAEGYEPEYPRQEFHNRINRDGEVRSLESAWKCKDGSFIYVRENAYLVLDENNQSSYYEGTVEDISEQKKTEETLRNSEMSLQSVLKSTADGILAIGRENEILYASERFAELWRIPPLVMSSKDDSILLNHVLDQLSDPQCFLKKVQELYQSKEESFDTLTFRDGRVFERLSRPLLQGIEVVGRVWSFRDITESKQIEEKLEKERILLRTLIDNIPDRVYVMDAQGRKILSNIADSLASGGKTVEDVIGKTDLETYPLELAKKIWSANMEVIETGTSIFNREEPGLDSQGNPVWVLSSKVPLRDGHGKITGLVGVGRDITGRKKAEELQDAIYRIAQAADQAESLDSLYPSIHTIIREVMVADNFYFALYDEKNEMLSFPYYIDQHDEKPSAPTPIQGLTGYVIRSEHSLLATREILDRLVQQGEVKMMGTESVDWLGVPLKLGRRMIGVMTVQSYTPGIHFKKKDLELLEFVSTQVAQAIERKRLEEEIRSLSLTDELTGLHNRRGFSLLAEREVILAHRMNRSMLLLFGDVDNFKDINDTWGHAQGDLALKEISKILKENFRESDIVARIGGDEFVILAVDGSLESAETMANRIHTFFSMRNQQGDKSYQLSLSLGIAHFNPEAPISVSELITQADGLMYQQKHTRKARSRKGL